MVSIEQFGILVGVVTGIAGMIISIFALRKSNDALKQERFFRWDDSYKKHSELISSVIFNGWNKSSGILASCEYRDGRLVYHTPRELDQQYENQAKKHLESGYPQVWKFYEDAKSYSVNISNKIKELIENFEKQVTSEISASCPTLVGTEEWSPKYILEYYRSSTVFSVVFSEALERSKGRKSGTFENKTLEKEATDAKGNRIILKELCFSGSGLGQGESTHIEELQMIINGLMSRPEIWGLVSEYYSLKGELDKNDKAELLDKEVRNIYSRTHADQPLKGSCDLCPNKSNENR